MVTAQATGAGWKIEGPLGVAFLDGDEFGIFLAHMRRIPQDVLIYLCDTSCDECGAAPNESHVFGCQYLLD